MRSSRKLKFKRRKHFHSIEQPLINLNLKYPKIQMKLRYLKPILQSRSSLLPSYCIILIFFKFHWSSVFFPSEFLFQGSFRFDMKEKRENAALLVYDVKSTTEKCSASPHFFILKYVQQSLDTFDTYICFIFCV